ncbi:pirin-like C-terminal cupin domain-containing protein [Gramella sp. AN32]|uniref:Pirin-like C-terminal cupin domain-containing protein n=1 Tax=Christiangramia antarctica TaxID=2058158 RepID=A0ABW5X8N1_9FLAO|nr:pirin-like C-terminal cupin domain-containing protein [Gramella sp. AN32]MCM4156105.1 hypothetical protein [Gramella sp. AN32]
MRNLKKLHKAEYHPVGDLETLLFGHAKPFEEKVVFGNPFVMNSEAEIQQAYDDFHSGKMGS